MAFQKAVKEMGRVRLALVGASGTGKTYSALRIGCTISKKVALIDTEHGSAAKYADTFSFDTMLLDTFNPQKYIEAIHEAEKAGYEVIILDSLSHAWFGKEGALEQVDKIAARSQSHNTYFAWREVTPVHMALIDAMLQSSAHIIATMRAKTEYVVEDNGNGKKVPRKIGLAPIQRDGMDYEFDVVGTLAPNNSLVIDKTRLPSLNGKVIAVADEEFAKELLKLVSTGARAQATREVPPVPAPPPAGKPQAATEATPAPAAPAVTPKPQPPAKLEKVEAPPQEEPKFAESLTLPMVRQILSEYMDTMKITDGKKVAEKFVHPFGAKVSKNLMPAKWAEVVKAVAAEYKTNNVALPPLCAAGVKLAK
jgi:hypothetical protein